MKLRIKRKSIRMCDLGEVKFFVIIEADGESGSVGSVGLLADEPPSLFRPLIEMERDAAFNALHTVVMCQAFEGIDIESEAYREAMRVTVEVIRGIYS